MKQYLVNGTIYYDKVLVTLDGNLVRKMSNSFSRNIKCESAEEALDRAMYGTIKRYEKGIGNIRNENFTFRDCKVYELAKKK